MIKKNTLTFFLAVLLLLPPLTCADTFSTMGTRWPSGLKKTLAGSSTTLFVANGDIVAAYDKTNMTLLDQITLNAPEGIIAIDYMEIVVGLELAPLEFVIAACGTGGLQVIPFDGVSFSLIEDSAVITQSDTARPNTPSPVALNIKGCVSFDASSEHLIAAIDDNYGYRVFQFTKTQTPVALNEVAQQELSDEAFTMLVDLDRWEKTAGHDCILTVAKNRELGLLDMKKEDLTGTWRIVPLGKATIDIPNLPSTELLYFSSLTLRVSGDQAYVIENSLGYFFSFAVNESEPFLQQTYPLPNTEGITLGYPLDFVIDGAYAYITTLMEKDGNKPGVQVMDLSSKAVTGTLEQMGSGALHKEGTHLFLMDLKNGLSQININDKANPIRVATPNPTEFAVHELLARENYLFLVDGLTSAEGGFRIIDISNAAQPKRIHVDTTEGCASDIAVDGDFYRLFVADGEAGVQCYSMNSNLIPADKTGNDFGGEGQPPIPSPETPCHLETLSAETIGGNALKVTTSYKNINGINTNFLHILTDIGTLVSVGLPTTETEPGIDITQMKPLTLPGTPNAIDSFLNDYILVASGAQGLQIVDLFSDPNSIGTLDPAIEASYVNGLSNTVSVSTDGSRYAYIADDSAGLIAFDLFSDQNTPAVINLSKVSHYTLAAGHFLDLFVTSNNNIYAVTNQELDNIQVLDVSKPDAITILGSETTLGSPKAIVAATTGGLSPDTPALRAAYVADGQGGLSIRQTTNDDNSQEQTWKDNSTSCFINSSH